MTKNSINNNSFISSKDDDDEDHAMHSKCGSLEIVISDETNEIIVKIFNSLKNRYQNNLQSMKCSESVFDYVHLLYYKCVIK